MYTDTKNIMNTVNNADMTYSRLQASKSKNRLGKMWKPLLRLISSKQQDTTTQNTIKHPNNINLNNAKPTLEVPPPLVVDLPTKTLPTDEELQQWQENSYQQYCTAVTTSDHIDFIKSASIDKTPVHNSQNCIYGRNCQDLLHDHCDVAKVLLPTSEQTYNWHSEEHKVDEELLNALYICHYRQFSVPAMQASLC